MRSKCSLASLIACCVGALFWMSPVVAQQVEDPVDNLDDIAPLQDDLTVEDIPDFGVAWPEMDEPIEGLDFGANDEAGADQEQEIATDTAQSEVPADSLETQEIRNLLTDSDAQQSASDDFVEGEADDLVVDSGFDNEYRTELTGLPEDLDQQFFSRFDELSNLNLYASEKSNYGQIRRRAESDSELVEELLRLEGYYDATVRIGYRPDPNESGRILVVIDSVPGPQYEFANIALPGIEAATPTDQQQIRVTHGLEIGTDVDSDEIIAAAGRVDIWLAETGYAFAKVPEPSLVIDHAARSADLTQPVVPGGKYDFGAILLTGDKLFNARHVQKIARFDPGDLYRQSDIEDLRRALIATGLVSTISLKPVPSEDPDKVDVAIDISAAPLRTIAGEVGYGTGEGFRVEASWEHRNLFPPEGLMRFTGVAGTEEQLVSVDFRRSNFTNRDTILNARLEANNVKRDAFEARAVELSANIERVSNLLFQKRLGWSAGFELIATDERDITGSNAARRTFFIGALPASVTFDTSDNLLDPTRGFRLSARLAPEVSLDNGTFYYLRSQFDASAYAPINDRLVIAGRARLGSILGAGSNSIAPSRRLYAGGGGSVRGYGYQKIGPLDLNNNPAGGRGLAEFSLEARYRTGDIGIVPFIDAGTVGVDEFPNFDNFRIGAGIGVRYYTNFGPIRIDVGAPLNPAPGDAPVAVYVSLGQAF